MNLSIAGLSVLLFCISSFAAPITDPVVFVSTIKAEEIADQLSYPVRIESTIKASILSDYEGVVTQVLVPLGQRVRKGVSLFKVEQTDPVFQYAPMNVKSSVPGVVSAIRISVGSRVVKGQELAIVTDPTALRGVMEVSSLDLRSITRDMNGTLRFPGSEQKFKIKVLGVAPQLDLITGTAMCELSLDSKDLPALTPGQVGQASFSVNSRNGIVINESALVYRGNSVFARVVKENLAHFVPVKIGKKARGNAEIVEGLKIGDLIVDRASGFVADGAKVQVQDVKPEATKKQ